jgi:hypothetical protein
MAARHEANWAATGLRGEIAGFSTFKIRQQTGHASDAMLSRCNSPPFHKLDAGADYRIEVGILRRDSILGEWGADRAVSEHCGCDQQ